ncbi:MAG: hypothetical protein ACJ8FY_10520 [Gemmataceae bacterium]
MKVNPPVDRVLADILALDPYDQVQLWRTLERDYPNLPIMYVFRLLLMNNQKLRLRDNLAALDAMDDSLRRSPMNQRFDKEMQLVIDKKEDKLSWSQMAKKHGQSIGALRQRERRARAMFDEVAHVTDLAGRELDLIGSELEGMIREANLTT